MDPVWGSWTAAATVAPKISPQAETGLLLVTISDVRS
jgi:hypothetical protein